MDFLFGDQNKKEIKEYEKIISLIMKHKRVIVSLSDEELKNKTLEFKERLNSGESLDDILPEAFAVAREASRRFLGKEQREVQLMGAIALHRGDIAEMKTGEGKTLTAPLAAYLNALAGKSVHIATSNDYLATRDRNDISPMFEGLGLTVGVVTEERDTDTKTDLENRKKAYSCDIVYGSSNAFAFDYLKDNTAKTKEQLVRSSDPSFIIIDEADQILVNDAVMPFKLSGSLQKNNASVETVLKKIQQKDQEEKQARLESNVNAFIYKLFKDKEHCGQFRTLESMKLHQGGNKEETFKSQRKYSVLYCKSNEANLTERGWLEAFRYFRGYEIDSYINDNVNLIKDNNDFKLDEDYYLEGDRIILSLSGIEKAVKNIPVIKQLNNAFYSSSEFDELNTAIDNALKAYFVLEKGKEYVLEDTIDQGIVKKKVSLVSNGRTAEGRVYSGGLQQAIELKEKKLNRSINIATTKEHDELASISQKAFYGIYPKISGMTGTSARELFENVYGMNTISVPKHSEYRVSDDNIDRIYSGRVDKDTVLFETEQEKMEAVITSVLESYKKGQPVLIGTLSVNESNRLYEEFRRRGILCEKLNAENVSLESKIISRAGKKGAITISTQMAGRGTDIKLGGELSYAVELEKEKLVESTAERLDPNIPMEERRKMATSFIEKKKMDIVTTTAFNQLEKEKQDLINVGGLKVIGYGHFATKRDDDQLRGRAARQDDPGTTEFYVSVNDLKKNLAVPNYQIASLRKEGLAPNTPLSGLSVEKVIASAQNIREGIITDVISSTQEVDYNLSIMRKKIYDQRARMIKGEDTKDNMEYIIDSSIVNLVSRNIPNNSFINYRKKVDKSGLNIHNFIIDVEETFGIELTQEFEEGKFKTLGDIEKYLSVKAKDKYNDTREKNGEEKQDEVDRSNIISTIDNAWLTFNENLDYIKFQNSMHKLVQNKEYDEIFAMKKGFNQCMAESKLQMLGKMFGKTSTKTRQIEEENIITDEIDNINDYQVNDRKSYTNLSVRPVKIIAALGEKARLIKEKIKYQFELIPVDNNDRNETIQSVSFDKEDNYTSTKK